MCPTYDAVLDAEAQLILEIWPLDEDGGHRRTADDVHLHLNLVLQALHTHRVTHTFILSNIPLLVYG